MLWLSRFSTRKSILLALSLEGRSTATKDLLRNVAQALACANQSATPIDPSANRRTSLGLLHSYTLQRFAKGLLRLVVLVAVSFVKLVRTLANHVRSHGHALAPVLSRPLFRRCKQPRARSGASHSFVYDEPVHFGADLDFKKRLPAHMQPADDSILRRFRHKHSMLRGGFDSVQSLAHLGRGCRIPKLSAELRNPLRIGALRAPDLQFVLACESHQLQAVFLRNRACTASLFSSRSASAAIHRAAREFCLRILSAARIASRFSRIFRFPMFRKAQLIAFFTRFLSSCASRSITFKNFTNRESGASLSL